MHCLSSAPRAAVGAAAADGVVPSAQARFADIVKYHCDELQLEPVGGDYRAKLPRAPSPSFFWPLGEQTSAALDARFESLAGGRSTRRVREPLVAGREIELTSAGGVARVGFNDLCDKALGAADYIAIAQRYDTLVIDDVPQVRCETRRDAPRSNEIARDHSRLPESP